MDTSGVFSNFNKHQGTSYQYAVDNIHNIDSLDPLTGLAPIYEDPDNENSGGDYNSEDYNHQQLSDVSDEENNESTPDEVLNLFPLFLNALKTDNEKVQHHTISNPEYLMEALREEAMAFVNKGDRDSRGVVNNVVHNSVFELYVETVMSELERDYSKRLSDKLAELRVEQKLENR